MNRIEFNSINEVSFSIEFFEQQRTTTITMKTKKGSHEI